MQRPVRHAGQLPGVKRIKGACHVARSLNYEDCVCDGLYDLWGSFPELRCPAAPGAPPAGCFPSLGALARIPFWPGDVREVCRQPTC